MMKKKQKKNKKNFNINQTSFYYEDYLETNKKNKIFKNSYISQDRVYLLFFLFFSLILIFAIKITFLSLKNPKNYQVILLFPNMMCSSLLENKWPVH